MARVWPHGVGSSSRLHRRMPPFRGNKSLTGDPGRPTHWGGVTGSGVKTNTKWHFGPFSQQSASDTAPIRARAAAMESPEAGRHLRSKGAMVEEPRFARAGP